MIAYISIVDDQTVRVMVRAVGDGDLVGDLVELVVEGQSFSGVPYERLRDVAPGQIEIV